jgi:hypothetical protein
MGSVIKKGHYATLPQRENICYIIFLSQAQRQTHYAVHLPLNQERFLKYSSPTFSKSEAQIPTNTDQFL